MPYDSTLAPPPPLPAAPAKPPARPIAHWTHTLAIVLFMLLSAALSSHRAASLAEAAPHLLRYGTTIALEWLLLGSVIAGIYRRREFFTTAFLNRSFSFATSLGLGALVYVIGFVAMGIAALSLYKTPLIHKHNEAVVLAMLPHTPLEFAVWFLVALTAGVCEEVIFRGYLLQQLSAWTQRPVAAILIAGVLFGSLHAYEGLAAIVPLAVLGIVYGFVVRHFKGDLRTVIVAHTLQDFLVALFALARPFAQSHQPHP
jgi:membrane protease YdiL (CAAX protease family)